jgi:4-amino-4-deoxy-L-arabinose transferase-like glycosyltransferase
VLALQTLAALRLVFYKGAYIDEATYAYAGSQELAHWIHGIAVSDFQSWMSGAPVVYPPLDAIATSIGGLAGGRLLSLAFILIATVLLYATGSRLFGRNAGLLGAALFASLGATQFVSALATYDAMALCCLAGSVYLVVRWAGRLDMPSVIYSGVAAPLLLVAADAAKYAAALWDPFVVALVVAVSLMAGRRWTYALAQGLRFGLVLTAMLAALLSIGKGKYVGAIFGSTVTRSSANPGMGQSQAAVLHVGLVYGGLPIAAAVVGTLLVIVPGRGAPAKPRAPYFLAGCIFVLAAVAPVLAQARIGTSVSLDKHVAFGAWFGCVLGGYALARLLKFRVLQLACGLVLVTVLLAYGSVQAQRLNNWPTMNSAFVTGLKKVVRPSSVCRIGAAACQPEYLLVGQVYLPAYYVGASVNSMQWKETFHFTYHPPHTHVVLTGPGALLGAIRDRVFAAIIVEPNGIGEPTTIAAIERYGGYRLDTLLPSPFLGSAAPAMIWTRTGHVTSAP